MLLYEAGQSWSRCVRNDSQPDPSGSGPSDLDRSHDQRLLAPFPAPSQADLGAADVGLVDLDLLVQQLSARTHHGPPELMKHRPSGLVPPNPKLTLELERGQTRWVGRYQVGCPEPLGQGRAAAVQDGASGHRRVVSTFGTPPQRPGRQLKRLPNPAPRASEAVRPTRGGKVSAAGALASELRLELPQRLGEVRPGHAVNTTAWE